MNKRHTGFGLTALAAVLMLFQAVPRVVAQDQDYDQDPPGRAGRVGYVQGTVSFQPGGEGDWLDAIPNRPLTTGDNLWADRDASACALDEVPIVGGDAGVIAHGRVPRRV